MFFEPPTNVRSKWHGNLSNGLGRVHECDRRTIDHAAANTCGLMVGYWTCDREVVGSTPSWVTIKLLLLGWVTVWRQVNHLGIYSM